MKDDNDINKHTAQIGFLIAVIGLCAMVVALFIGDSHGWLHY